MLILLATGAPPLEALKQLLIGSIGSGRKIADVLVAWVPLLLATTGVLVTFAAGLWNIGIEGQIVLGGIFATGALRALQASTLPGGLILFISLLAAMLGGMFWALLAGALKTFGGVNEIFGGLGLNFIATALTIWLIFGPWKRPGIGSMSGTEPFDERLWLPTLPGLRLSLWSLALGLLAALVIGILLSNTYFGLRLKAVGRNRKAAYLLGVPTWQHMMAAFALCGILAGMAGWVQVAAVYHRLIPSISSGYGFLGLLVAMLVNYSMIGGVLVSLFFAAINIGSIQLPILLKLDSSLSGVLQGVLVLFVLLMQGIRRKVLPSIEEKES
jgi:simple sugar transport system permease protein